MTTINDRKVQVFKKGEWIDASFKGMTKGTRFRMFEPDGTQVLGESDYEGLKEFEVVTEPLEVNGIWGCQSKGIAKKAITSVHFKERTGRDPKHDDLERCNCPEAGHPGHYMCGWCEKCDMPKFMCVMVGECSKRWGRQDDTKKITLPGKGGMMTVTSESGRLKKAGRGMKKATCNKHGGFMSIESTVVGSSYCAECKIANLEAELERVRAECDRLKVEVIEWKNAACDTARICNEFGVTVGVGFRE